MSNEKFTQGEWYLGNPFRHKDSRSEWRNVYADGEKNPIAVVLVNDGCGKAYHNATLLQSAPEMYRELGMIEDYLRFLVPRCCPYGSRMAKDMWMRIDKIIELRKKARGEE